MKNRPKSRTAHGIRPAKTADVQGSFGQGFFYTTLALHMNYATFPVLPINAKTLQATTVPIMKETDTPAQIISCGEKRTR